MDAQYVTALAALAAVVLGPLTSYWVVNRQITATVRSGSRQQWVNDLRASVSAYCGLMNSINQARSLDHLTYQEIYPKMQSSFELETKIMLLLNPQEPLHKHVTDLTTKGRVSVFGTPEKYHPETWNEIWYDLVRTVSAICRAEWKRVKNLE